MEKTGASVNLKKVAVTGGIASGKSAVCRFFQELGAFVVSTDAVVHDLISSSVSLRQELVQYFGHQILSHDNMDEIDRKALAQEAFKDPISLRYLEERIHPAVMQRIRELYERASCQGGHTSFVVEIPLLYEVGQESFYDWVVVVIAEESLCKERFLLAGFSPGEYEKRMHFQLSPQAKAARAHYILENNGTLDALKKQVIQLNKKIHT